MFDELLTNMAMLLEFNVSALTMDLSCFFKQTLSVTRLCLLWLIEETGPGDLQDLTLKVP